MFNGSIEGAGPRYCPSIEDKVARYRDKDEHPVFLEPEGWQSNELYVQGMSTSLPADVQIAALRAIHGLESVEITRYGYAVEYDAVDANQLTPTLESRLIPGLFLAGQINGTSGYEEAAGQGLVAGLNASRTAAGRQPLSFTRTSGYIGVMIDDLVNLPFLEPYRMLTARAEYRLSLRPDSAERRLNAIALEAGLISHDRGLQVERELRSLDAAHLHFQRTFINPNGQDDRALQQAGIGGVAKPMSLAEIVRRPKLTLMELTSALPASAQAITRDIPDYRRAEFETDLKYAAFIERETREIARLRSMDQKHLPVVTDQDVPGLRNEARQQIAKHQPQTYGDAQRLAGVTPADLAALMIHQSRMEHPAK
jgi:tRNA uridine 5-carboxymethylaminomethyl modification enzyme